MTTNTVTQNGVTYGVKPIKDAVMRIPLNSIYVSFEWNSRLYAHITKVVDEDSNEDDGARGTKGIEESIAESYQLTPVDVRVNDGSDPTIKQPYILVTGYRRVYAIRALAARGGRMKGDTTWNSIEPTVRARVHKEMNALEARKLNMVENLQRAPLVGADLAFGIHDLWELSGKKLKQVEIGSIVGKTQNYMSYLMSIVQKTNPTILNDWRNAVQQLSIQNMFLVSKAAKEEQKKIYDDLIAKQFRDKDKKVVQADGSIVRQSETGDTNVQILPEKKIEKAKKQAKEAGAMLGLLVGYGYFQESDLEWEQMINILAPIELARNEMLPQTVWPNLIEIAKASYQAKRIDAEQTATVERENEAELADLESEGDEIHAVELDEPNEENTAPAS